MKTVTDLERFYFDVNETAWRDVAARVSGLMPPALRNTIYEAVRDKKILPGTPILRNALSAGNLNMASCHTLQIGNSVARIWHAAKECALIFKSGGGGVGIDFSRLSPRGYKFKYSRQVSSGGNADTGRSGGPASFLPLFETTARLIGSARSGKKSGMMGTLRGDHPDALEWAQLKASPEGRDTYQRFNLSLTIPAGPASVPEDVWEAAIQSAWLYGDPGMVFLDNVNRQNPMHDEMGAAECVNVCAEVLSYPDETCFLGSVVLPRCKDLAEVEHYAYLLALLLNRVVDLNAYPLPQMRERAHDLRRIGAGVMGFADVLGRQGIAYASPDSLSEARAVIGAVDAGTEHASAELAEQFGGYRDGRLRNISRMAIAPTGHISRLAGCSPSIYPDLYDPDKYKNYLRLSPEEHIDFLATWQAVVDGGISYTVSIPYDAGPEVVDRVFRLAWSHGIKGISVYRDGSQSDQPCSVGEGKC